MKIKLKLIDRESEYIELYIPLESGDNITIIDKNGNKQIDKKEFISVCYALTKTLELYKKG